DSVEHPISRYVAAYDELFRVRWELAGAGATAGHPVDRAAGADAGVVPRLHGRVLGFDAGLARGRAAGAGLAQSQARRSFSRRPLILAQLKREDRLKAAGPGRRGQANLASRSIRRRLRELAPLVDGHAHDQFISAAAGLEYRRLAFAHVEPVLAEGIENIG